jgi:TIR domain
MRAFLSHSSADKRFVEAVARELGRQFCAFDQHEFDSGEDFRNAIRKALDSSDLFILFASKTSRERKWVEFELDEAELRKIRGSIKRILVLLRADPRRMDSR